jgi:hypothetical protein
MHRRQFLALSSVGLIGTAGCVGSSSSESAPTETSASTATETASATATRTATSTAAETETATPDPYGSAKEGFVRAGVREVEFYQYLATDSFRYYDAEDEELKQKHPFEDWWAEAIIHLRNLGGEELPPPNEDLFQLLLDGERFDGRTMPPVDWETIRFEGRMGTWWVEPGLGHRHPIDAGEMTSVILLFDAPADATPILLWDSPDGEKRLRPGYVHEPGEEAPL